MAAELTLGAEEELHLIDLTSRQLSARAPQVLAQLSTDNYSAELQRTTVELNTEVTDSLGGLRSELVRLRAGLGDVVGQQGLGLASVGTAPRSAHANDFELTSTGRYGRMQEQYRLLVDEQLICGLQVHVGVSDRDLAVRISQRIALDLPILLALSASSPFWNGQDTGYSSIRTLIWQRWPSAGAMGPIGSAAEYDALIADLIASGVIADSKMAYFDVRPSAHAPTLELRVCDACPLVDDAVAIAGLYRALVRAAEIEVEADRPFRPWPVPVQRAASWQAARRGLSGDLLLPQRHPEPVPAHEAVRDLVRRVSPQLEELGDLEDVSELVEALLVRGNSADRQRAAYAERGSLDDVVDLVIRESQGEPGGAVPSIAPLRRYRTRAGDEAVSPDIRPRPVYREVVEFFRTLGPEGVAEREVGVRADVEASGMTFAVRGEHRPFDVDLMPRIIRAHDWHTLAEGLCQRARAIELFLQDIYGEGLVIRNGVLPFERAEDVPGWRPEAAELPAGTVRAPVMGFDLIRNEFGGWRVLEDNVRAPSGTAYGLGIRELMDRVLPDLPRPDGLLDPADAVSALGRCLRTHAPEGTRAALLSSGPASSAWYEHRLLAERSGLLLVGPDDLVTDADGIRHRDSGERIGSLYLRLDDELVDLVGASGVKVGERILAAAAAGQVVLANAPGNGVADDKAMYSFVPVLIGYYLDERALLESVPTYRPGDESEYRVVLERVGELVTKPVGGHGGRGVLIGPDATAYQVRRRRAEVAADPKGWVAQEVVQLSSLPTFGPDGTMGPRHVDLRAFVFLTGTGPDEVHLAPVALTRVAPESSLVVNSSAGGGAKDTWILGPDAVGGDEGSGHVRVGG